MSADPTEPAEDILDTRAAGPAAIRGGGLRAAGYALGMLLTLVSVPLIVRHLGVVDFGRFVLVTSLMTLVVGLTEGGLAAVGLREYTLRSAEERKSLMSNLLGVRLALTGAGVSVATAFAIVAGYDATLVVGTLVVGAGLMAQASYVLLAVPLQAELRNGWITIADLLRQTIFVSLSLALVVAGAALMPFFVATIPASLAALAVTVVLVRRTIPLRPRLDWGEWWILVRDMLPYAAAIAVNVAYFRIAIVIMSLVATELETGYFATSFRVLEVLLPLPALLIGAVFPILARSARDDLERLTYASQRVLDVALIAGSGLALGVFTGAPAIIDVVAGQSSEPSIEVLRIQAPALVATFVAVGCGFSLLSLRRYRALLVPNLVALAVSVGLTLTLAPELGARGAAIATTSAECSLAIVVTALLIGTGDRLRLSFATAGPVALATALGVTVVFVPGLPALAQVVIAVVLYVGVLALTRTIPRELFEAVALVRPRS